MKLSRRTFLAAAATLAPTPALARPEVSDDWTVGVIPDTPYNIPLINLDNVPPAFRRADVRYTGPERPGTLLVDVTARHIYLVQERGRAIRFGIAVGREGAAWKGTAKVGRKAKWPSWTPTANMRRRDPSLPVTMAGGPGNPLGARALYLYENGRDTLYRIHGTNQPASIGKAASSGCIRMLNEDVFELYGSVPVGATVIVR